MDTSPSPLARLLEAPRYEVFPLDGIDETVAEHVPREIAVTVTASPRKGLEATLVVAERLVGKGFRVVPHLPARFVTSEGHLEEIVRRLGALGVREVLVIAGDAEEPAGPFADAFALLFALSGLGHSLEEIDIAGYPESHPFISDEATVEAMFRKEPFATRIVSQVCFDAATIGAWVARVRRRGVELPIYVGVPGPISRLRLLQVSTRIGVGESARFLRRHRRWAKLMLRRRYRPDRLITRLADSVAKPGGIAGLHIYTFNRVAETERWRQEALSDAR